MHKAPPPALCTSTKLDFVNFIRLTCRKKYVIIYSLKWSRSGHIFSRRPQRLLEALRKIRFEGRGP